MGKKVPVLVWYDCPCRISQGIFKKKPLGLISEVTGYKMTTLKNKLSSLCMPWTIETEISLKSIIIVLVC